MGAFAVFARPLATGAQAAKVYRVGLVFGASPLANMLGPDPVHPYARAFVHELRARGYVEGQNIIVERRSSEGNVERYRDVVAELVQLHMDVIVVATTAVALAAKEVTSTVPIVCACGSALESGLVANLARPGTNFTGVGNYPTITLAVKRLETFKQAIPQLSRVALIYAPEVATQSEQFREMAKAGQALGITVIPVPAERPEEFPRALVALSGERIDGLIPADSSLNLSQRRQLVEFAAANRLAAIYAQQEFVDVGGLMSYGVNIPEVYRRLAGYVDRILMGAKASDLPMEQPTKFELVINLQTAKALGVTIPQSLLLRADRVIE